MYKIRIFRKRECLFSDNDNKTKTAQLEESLFCLILNSSYFSCPKGINISPTTFPLVVFLKEILFAGILVPWVKYSNSLLYE